MKNILCYIILSGLLVLSACTIDEQFDPNNPSISGVVTDATPAELNLLVYGAASRMRNNWDVYCTSTGTIARELYLFDADPRNTEDLLGKDGVSLDNNTFYLTAPYITRYQTVKNCNLLLEGLEDATGDVNEAQKQGYRGYANTIKSLMFLQELMRLGTNGIRVDVADPENLGPFLSQSEAFAAIDNLLDEAFDQLQGAEFRFDVPGFDGFNTPAGFAEFNRAVAVRAAIYQEDYERALTVIGDSFFDLDGSLDLGPDHVFSTSSGDILNPVFRTPGQSGDQIIVNPDVIDDIRDGDTRFSKFALRVEATSQDDLNGDYETALYESALSPISIIRNEELILSFAEASIQTGKAGDAVNALNIIRNAYGLGDYEGAQDEASLIDEMLYQRRYSFWGEGHRMFDLRRYDRLNADFIPIDRDGDQIFQQFPIPLTENQ